MAKQGSRKGRDEQASDRDRVHDADAEQPPSDKTEEGLPFDMLPQAGQGTETSSPQEDDLASLLSSFQESEDDSKPDSETEEDRELSRMISLMASGDPGLAHPGGATQERSAEADEPPEALPEDTEVILDAGASSETPATTAEAGAETELASTSGDETLEDRIALDGADGPEQAQASPEEDEPVEAGAIEGYDVTDTLDALLSTIGLDEEQEGRSFVPSVPEGGIQDDGTPVEELVDDRILEDFQELRKNLQPPIPASEGVSAAMSLSGSLSEGHAHILCIDDDPDNRSLFKGVLDAKDYSFVDAESGEEALEVLRESDVDLVLLNLDIASQDGFELIEEAASDVALSQVPILVNSASIDHIEKALRLGASDYLIRPMSVIDVKFQIPIKVKNLLKIRRAERMLALTGGPRDGDLVAVPPAERGPETQARDLPAPGDEGLSGLLSAQTSTASRERAEASAESLEDLLKEDEEEDEETLEDLTAALDENEEDLAAVLNEEVETSVKSPEDLFKEGEKEDEDEETREDLTTVLDKKEEDLTENVEDLFKEGEKEDEDEETLEDLTAALATEEEDLDKLFDDSPSHPAESDQAADDLPKVAGPAAAGAAAMRPPQKPDEEPRSASEILAQPSRRGASPIWRSPDIARSQRERTLQERRVELPRRSGGRRLIYATLALLLVGVGIWTLWAKQRLRETGEVTSVFPTPQFQAPEISTAPAEKPAESPSITGSESAPSPAPSGGGSGYEQAREQASPPSRQARQLAAEKARFRATVEQLAASGGQWWAPWRVIRESGESIRELVNSRRRDDILEVFGVSEERVEQGLRREAVVNFLSKRGFKIRGKQVSDLSAREVFEILSMREIKTKDKIVAILSALKEKAAAAREGRAARLKASPPSRFALRPEPLKIAPPARRAAVWEQPIGVQGSTQAGQTTDRPHPPPS